MSISKSELLAEICVLRDRVVGVTDLAMGTVDGLLMVADIDETVNSESLAAMTAATVGLARRTGDLLGRGAFHQSVLHFGDGYVVTRAVGQLGLMAVMGDAGMDMARLHLESQLVADRIGRRLAEPEQHRAVAHR